MTISIEALTARAALDSIDIVKIDLQRAHPAAFGALEPPPELRFDLTVNVRVPNHLSASGFAVLVEADCEWRQPGGEPVGALSVTYRLAYSIAPGAAFDAVDLMGFATNVAIHHAWPFLRERVRVLSGEMGLPPLLLPMRHLSNLPASGRISGTVRVGDRQAPKPR